jgi:hypothetical protein
MGTESSGASAGECALTEPGSGDSGFLKEVVTEKQIVAGGPGNPAAGLNLPLKSAPVRGYFRPLERSQASDSERGLFYVNPYKSKGQSSKSKNGGRRQDYNSLKTMTVRQQCFGVLVARWLCSADSV